MHGKYVNASNKKMFELGENWFAAFCFWFYFDFTNHATTETSDLSLT